MLGKPTDRVPWQLMVSCLSFFAMILVWELICRMGWIEPIFLPAPSQIADRAVKMYAQGTLIEHVAASTRRVMVGFFFASLAAIPLGIFLGTSRFFMAVFDPIISIWESRKPRNIPSFSWERSRRRSST